MHLDGQQLAAFAAVIERGSFDAAAEHLHVTPSAVSQRIKALDGSFSTHSPEGGPTVLTATLPFRS